MSERLSMRKIRELLRLKQLGRSQRQIASSSCAWPPERLIAWGASFGLSVGRVVELTLARYANPEQGCRACLGLMRTAQQHGAARMNLACERALSVPIVGGPRRKYIEAILKRGLEREATPVAPTVRTSPLTHENVRGGAYYDKETVH